MKTQNIHAPAVDDRLAGIPLALGGSIEGVQELLVMIPRQLCSKLIDPLDIWPGLGEHAHVAQVARRKHPGLLGECLIKISGESVDDLGFRLAALLPH